MSECERCGKRGDTKTVLVPPVEYDLCDDCATHVRRCDVGRYCGNSAGHSGP